MRSLVFTTCMIFLGATAITVAQVPAVPAPVQPDRKSPDYRTGMNDGCMHATFGQPRNEARYQGDTSYRMGWDVGFRNCYPHQTINTNGDPNGPMRNVF